MFSQAGTLLAKFRVTTEELCQQYIFFLMKELDHANNSDVEHV